MRWQVASPGPLHVHLLSCVSGNAARSSSAVRTRLSAIDTVLSKESISMTLDLARLCAELHRLEWARELGADVIQDIANVAEFREYSAGQIVVELDSEIKSAIFIVTGRLEVA